MNHNSSDDTKDSAAAVIRGTPCSTMETLISGYFCFWTRGLAGYLQYILSMHGATAPSPLLFPLHYFTSATRFGVFFVPVFLIDVQILYFYELSTSSTCLSYCVISTGIGDTSGAAKEHDAITRNVAQKNTPRVIEANESSAKRHLQGYQVFHWQVGQLLSHEYFAR